MARLRQGQSGKGQYGVVWHRLRQSPLWRDVQNYNRHRNAPRPLSRLCAHGNWSTQWPSAACVRQLARVDWTNQGWQAAPAGGNHGDPFGGAAGRSGFGRNPSRYEASAWIGVGAPKKTPAEIIDKLNKEINAALADPKIKARFADLSGTVVAGSPADFGNLIADETEKWGKVIRTANIKPE
jgi:hypothetical protein